MQQNTQDKNEPKILQTEEGLDFIFVADGVFLGCEMGKLVDSFTLTGIIAQGKKYYLKSDKATLAFRSDRAGREKGFKIIIRAEDKSKI